MRWEMAVSGATMMGGVGEGGAFALVEVARVDVAGVEVAAGKRSAATLAKMRSLSAEMSVEGDTSSKGKQSHSGNSSTANPNSFRSSTSSSACCRSRVITRAGSLRFRCSLMTQARAGPTAPVTLIARVFRPAAPPRGGTEPPRGCIQSPRIFSVNSAVPCPAVFPSKFKDLSARSPAPRAPAPEELLF